MGVSFEGYEMDATAAAAAAAAAAETQEELTKSKKSKKSKTKTKTKSKTKSKSKSTSVMMPEGLEAEAAAAMAVAGAMTKRAQWEVGLDRGSVEMVQSLRAFLAKEGAYAEPPQGSELAVWLARTRSRATTEDEMAPNERAALVAAGVELENFPAAWLEELQRYSSLKQRRGTLHAPAAVSSWIRQQRAAAAAGQLSPAQLRRLRAAGMSGLAGALMLDDSVMEVVEVLVDPKSSEDALEALEASRDVPLHLTTMDIKQQLSMLSLRENVAAAEAAAAARAEAEKFKSSASASVSSASDGGGYKTPRKVPARAAGRAPFRVRRSQSGGGMAAAAAASLRVKSSAAGGGDGGDGSGGATEDEYDAERGEDVSAELTKSAVPQEVVFEAEKTLEYMRSQGY